MESSLSSFQLDHVKRGVDGSGLVTDHCDTFGDLVKNGVKCANEDQKQDNGNSDTGCDKVELSCQLGKSTLLQNNQKVSCFEVGKGDKTNVSVNVNICGNTCSDGSVWSSTSGDGAAQVFNTCERQAFKSSCVHGKNQDRLAGDLDDTSNEDQTEKWTVRCCREYSDKVKKSAAVAAAAAAGRQCCVVELCALDCRNRMKLTSEPRHHSSSTK
jgi:hypothetical protein